MTVVTLMGAGGKMGQRIANKLKDGPYEMKYVEVSEAGIAALAALGYQVTPQAEAVPAAEMVIMAVPDHLMEGIAAGVVPKMKDGALLVLLDPAASFLGHLPESDRVGYFVVHPCHPAFFHPQPTLEAQTDYFGGVAAEQSILCALVQGTEEDYRRGEELAHQMFGPIKESYQVSVEEMTICEVVMAEAIALPLILRMREALNEAVAQGVPENAARDFMLGHIQIAMAVAFDALDTDFSDAAKVAAQITGPRLLRPGWRDFYRHEEMKRLVDLMLQPEKAAAGDNG